MWNSKELLKFTWTRILGLPSIQRMKSPSKRQLLFTNIRNNIPEGLNLHQHSCKNVKSRTNIFFLRKIITKLLLRELLQKHLSDTGYSRINMCQVSYCTDANPLRNTSKFDKLNVAKIGFTTSPYHWKWPNKMLDHLPLDSWDLVYVFGSEHLYWCCTIYSKIVPRVKQ
jgi:hypothetical protein